MAKPDLTRDYYADLELKSNATEAEIKKQFRQLALKYHPDRNPGRETEVNAKFQTIQAASEILLDPEQKAKYDSGRARGGRSAGSAFSTNRPASGYATGNPWANAGSNFPPPPTRNTHARPKPPPPSAGAQRYSRFGSTSGYPPPPKPAPAYDDAEERRRTYEAWNSMRGESKAKQSSQQARQPPPPRPGPPPVPKRNGYAPNNAPGDEPPAPSSYYTQRHRPPTAKLDPEPEQEARPPQYSNVDPLRGFRNEPRVSTPYAGRGGEKTNPFESDGTRQGRTPTSRTSSGSSKPFGGDSARDRRRSVSPARDDRKSHIRSDFNTTNRAESDSNINASPKRTFSKATRSSNSGQQYRTHIEIDTSSSDESSPEPGQRKFAQPKSRKTQNTTTPLRQSTFTETPQSNAAPKTDPKIFNFQVDGQTFAANLTPKQFASSAENVSTTFTPEDWHGKFAAGGDYFTAPPQPTPSRAKSAGTTRTGSPPKRRPHVDTNIDNSNVDPEILKQSKSAGAKTTPPSAEPVFNANDWAEHFAPPQPTPARSARPTTTSRRAKVGSSSSKGPKPRAAAVETDDDDILYMGSRTVPLKSNIKTERTFAESPTAMDIDPKPASNARKVHVEPCRQEWRTGELNGAGTEGPTPSPQKTQAKQRDGESDGDLRANLNDFMNTAPFNTPATGLKDMSDLKSNMPFPSKASSAVPFAKNFDAKLELPRPPKGPPPPTILPDAARPSQADFNQYLAQMKPYMHEWNTFNNRMLMHFESRKAQIDLYPGEWWNQIGDSVLNKYMEGLKEDEEVRTYWEVACGKHRATMEEFAWVKRVFRDGKQNAGNRSAPLFGEVA